MSRIDLARLRKSASMSQRQLASLLGVRPSFISAIENGHSRLPEEKYEKVMEIFDLDSLDGFITDEAETAVVPPHTHAGDPADSLTHLLTHIHDLAHQRDRSASAPDSAMTARLDFLTQRNDRLSDRLDSLRDEVDALRVENLRLKELLLKNGIAY